MAAITNDDPLLDERGVLEIHPVSAPTLKRQRKHPNPELRFPTPDVKFFEHGKNFWFASTVHRFHRQVAEYQRRLKEARAQDRNPEEISRDKSGQCPTGDSAADTDSMPHPAALSESRRIINK
jgi:hypothetical protein